MKKRLLYLAFIGVFSCKSPQDLMEIKQNVDTEQKVSLLIDHTNKDSISILFPAEFEIKNVSKKVAAVKVYYMIDGVMLEYSYNGFVPYNGETGNIIFAIENLDYDELPKSIVFRQRNYKIPYTTAQELLKKYTNHSIEKLKDNQEVELVPYNLFKKENLKMIEKLNKKPDSIFFSIAVLKEKSHILKKKIEW